MSIATQRTRDIYTALAATYHDNPHLPPVNIKLSPGRLDGEDEPYQRHLLTPANNSSAGINLDGFIRWATDRQCLEARVYRSEYSPSLCSIQIDFALATEPCRLRLDISINLARKITAYYGEQYVSLSTLQALTAGDRS